MTQEEKQLLLKDLCARIPYGVICKTEEGNGKLISIECSYGEDLAYVDFGNAEAEEYDLNDGDMVKPYLRLMSSMTEEEKGDINNIIHEFGDKWFESGTPDNHWSATFWECSEITYYLLSHHLDFHGLIPMGLALEAPEGMYKTDTEEEEEVKVEIPNTLEEALTILDKIVSEEDKEYLKENGAISAHLSLGMWIRNNWGFWENSDFYKYLCEKTGLTHPDDISNYIIEEFIKWKLDK